MTWAEHAAQTGLPAFPIHISWNGQKYEKKPLTRHGHLDASHDISVFDWSQANGYGIPMGNGLYALDVDDYKAAAEPRSWLREWQVPMQTRTHTTVSGGAHLIYRLPSEWADLRTRQNVVPGLDTRGAGGWIAFGQGYTVQNDADPAWMPVRVCRHLHAGGASGGPLSLPQALPVDHDETLRRLDLALTFGRPSLRHRWNGGDHGLHDSSASGFDMSMAKLLALAGFGYDEIVWLLSTQFQHGKARRDGPTRVVTREIKRCAARATQRDVGTSRKMREAFGHGR